MKKRNAFTLIEVLVVMGLMLLVMSISVVGFMGMRRGAELRGGAMSVRTTLMLARQQAVTKRQAVKVGFATNSMTVSFSAGNQTNRTTYFSPGITITPPSPNPLEFQPTGALASGADFTAEVKITEVPDGGTPPKIIKVWLLTGATKEM
jgi:prepilin-type N-terminal cleavage/methylation domain-containing protein